MTHVYFVRHAQPNYNNHDDYARELTEKGLADSKLVTAFLAEKSIDPVFSSPYIRAVDTIRDFTDTYHHEITIIDDFRERKVDSCWIEDFQDFSKRQWENFDYKLTDGETLRECQRRNIAALNDILRQHKDKNIVIGSHGTALSTIINYYQPSFSFADFEKIKGLMPWVVHFTFDGEACKNIVSYNLFEEKIAPIESVHIPECVRVIRESFHTVADEFGFTEENAPRFTAFATTEQRLKWQFN